MSVRPRRRRRGPRDDGARRRARPLLALALAAGCAAPLSGCSSPVVESGFVDVERLVGERLPQSIMWRNGAAEEAEVDAAVDELVSQPLSADAAVQVALLENRLLQAHYERLGISQADVVQAGLLRNPIFTVSSRFPDESPSGSNLEFGVVQDFLDVLARPGRLALAEAEFERAKSDVASSVLELACAARTAYYEALGSQQVTALRRARVDEAQAAAEEARAAHERGELDDLSYAVQLGSYEDARVAFAAAEAERLAARERLTGLMGLWRPEHLDYRLPEELPALPEDDLLPADLVALAVERRLDLAAAIEEIAALAQALDIAVDWSSMQMLELGLSSERYPDGQYVTGPNVSMELPLFDRGQARVARHEAELRQAEQKLRALAVSVRSEVRALGDRMIALRRLAQHYERVVLPLRASVLELSLAAGGDGDPDALLRTVLARSAGQEAQTQWLQSLRDYWITRSQLERAVGGSLSRPESPPAGASPALAGPSG